MQNTKSNSVQEMVGNAIRNLAGTSLTAYQPLMKGVLDNLSNLTNMYSNVDMDSLKTGTLFKETCNCCPPECGCPPHCIASIQRCATKGERIVVPFLVKNNCSHAKTWRVGVRELVDQDGKPAPDQPILNKNSLRIEPGGTERVLLTVDLDKFENGNTYNTEIVLREKEYNQNICFTLNVENNKNLVTAEPQDEKQFNLKWQSWQSHYYCEPPNKTKQDPAVIHVIKNK